MQGWLKGVNSTNLLSTMDMGQDGRSGANNNNIARDAYGFALHYYSNADYTPIGTTNPFGNATTAANYQALYNGNIAAQTVNIKKLGKPRLYVYGYDQLNRIKRVNAFTGLDSVSNVWTPVDSGKYRENFTYDGNGNILKANRNGNVGIMDSLSYQYTRDASGRLVNNKLNYVSDATNNVAYSTDIKDQPANNYSYDPIGNLIQDTQAGISNIDWSVYGKIKAITKNSGNIAYTYDPSGQRVTKTIGTLSTFYVRDAQGNTLALYDNASGHNNWKEQDLYGSSRLGIWTPNINLATGNAQTVYDTLGRKFFELTNHLGNVLETITDRRLQAASGSVVDHYEADVASAQSYYAFGMEMPGVSYNANNYRYGFNGQEKSTEIDPNGNINTAEFWEYDARLGRRWNIDPKSDIGISYCSTFNDDPILNNDPTGLKPTPKEAAAISENVYLNAGNKGLKGGWLRSHLMSDKFKDIKFVDPDNGLNSALYERTVKGKTEYVYATAGTEIKDLRERDVAEDILQLFGFSQQYGASVDNAKSISGALEGKELTFTGHSLGGGEAAANAYATGRDAVTFNAAALSQATEKNLWLDKLAVVDNYDVQGQLIKAQNLLGLKPSGVQHSLPDQHTLLQNWFYSPIMLGFLNHLMPAVNKGLATEKK